MCCMSQIYCKKGFKLQLNQNSFNLNFFQKFFWYTCWQFNRFKINLLLNYVRKVCNKLCFPLWNENPHKDIDYYYFMRYDNKLVGYNLLSRKIYLWKFCYKNSKFVSNVKMGKIQKFLQHIIILFKYILHKRFFSENKYIICCPGFT